MNGILRDTGCGAHEVSTKVERAVALTPNADFWGPASNFGIPIAAIADMSKDPEMYVASTIPHCRAHCMAVPLHIHTALHHHIHHSTAVSR